MQSPTPLQKVISLLEKLGHTEDEIGEICGKLTQNAFSMLYTKAVAALYETDFKIIEDCVTDEQANKKIMELYEVRTGRNPYTDMNLYLEKFAETFISQQ